MAGGFALVAESDAEHSDLFALGDDLGFSLRSRLLLVLAVIWLVHVQVNRYGRFEESAILVVTIIERLAIARELARTMARSTDRNFNNAPRKCPGRLSVFFPCEVNRNPDLRYCSRFEFPGAECPED